MKIPITMCHGISKRLSSARYENYFRMAKELNFTSINYMELSEWKFSGKSFDNRPIMFDFDHPVKSTYDDIFPIMEKYGFKGNLFVNTSQIEEMHQNNLEDSNDREHMTWNEIKILIEAGWHIGAHTHTHPNLSKLSVEDPTGEKIQIELKINDEILNKRLGIKPKEFAFTGTSWSKLAEEEVKKRYQFGRLWIIGSNYQSDGKPIRFADLVEANGDDEEDGGPPFESRYITEKTDPFKLPSMELNALIYEYDAFKSYLEYAFDS